MVKTLSQILDNTAQKHPNIEAFKCGNAVLSYAEILQKTNQFATHLVSLGVQKGDRVGIYLERSIETAIAIYGIMKAGAAYVPLDPSAPQSRIVFLLNDCNIEHLITSKLQVKKVMKFLEQETPLQSIIGVNKEMAVPTISWDTIFKISLEGYQPLVIKEDDLAYIMYTSGSTGAPKGIMHTHASGLSYAKLSSTLYDLRTTDRVANHAPLHFDISTFGYFSSPLAGACTIIVTDAHTMFPVSLADLIEKEKISIWYSAPLALIQLLQKGMIENKDFSSIRWVLYGGEVFVTKYLSQLMQLWSNAKFSNVYGPAEVNQCTYYHLENPSQVTEPLPIGYIWNETEYKILDQNEQEVSPGSTGELIVHSTTMMKGYWNNTTLTVSSMYLEEDTSGNKKRYYKTGDLVKLNEEGKLLFMGRNDFQVKVRGYRIEVNEVEAVVASHPEVNEAAVLTLDKNNGEKELVAAVLLKPDVTLDQKTLIDYCKSRLPIYAVPSQISILQSFPRTSSAKIDRKEIRKKIVIE